MMYIKYSSWHSAGLALSACQDTGEEVVLSKKIGLGDGSKLGSRMLRPLADDTETVSLVCECRELEEAFGTSFKDRILEAREGEGPHPWEIKEIMGRDQAQRMDRCSGRQSSGGGGYSSGGLMGEAVGCCSR